MTPEHARLVAALRELRLKAGQPSLRAIAYNTKHHLDPAERHSSVSHSAVGELLSGKRLPRSWVVEATVRSLGAGDIAHFRELWAAAERARLAAAPARLREDALTAAMTVTDDPMHYLLGRLSRELDECRATLDELAVLVKEEK